MNKVTAKAFNTIKNDRIEIAKYQVEVAAMKAAKKQAKIEAEAAKVQAKAETYMVWAMVIAIVVTLCGASFIGFGIAIHTLISLINK